MRPGDPDPQAGFTLLNELSESEIAWLLAEGKVRFCERDSLLVKEGSRIECLYLILEGVFSVRVGGQAGREIAKLGPGQIAGEMSFLEDRPASATVIALEGSQVLGVSRAQLDAKLRYDTAFSAHLFRAIAIVVSRRLRDAVGQLGRWLESEPVAEPEVLARWSEIARTTQKFKETILQVTAGADGDELPPTDDLATALREFTNDVNDGIGDQSPETVDAREELGARIQRELAPYFLKARTPAQLFEKPRGYPGDFHAVEMIVRAEPDGTTAAGKLIDGAFLALPFCQALRSSHSMLHRELAERSGMFSTDSLRVAAIAAAPAAELFEWPGPEVLKPLSRVTIIEFDDEALVRLRAMPPLGIPVRLEMETLVDLALGRHRVAPDAHEIAYALTVANALSDRFFVGLLNYLHGLLEPGGWVTVGCFHPRNPDKAFLQHILGWPLHHRTEAEVNTLFRHSLFGSACDGFCLDEQGIYFLASCEKA